MLLNTDSLISSTCLKLDLLGVGLTTQYASVSWIYAGYHTTLQKCVTVFCQLNTALHMLPKFTTSTINQLSRACLLCQNFSSVTGLYI